MIEPHEFVRAVQPLLEKRDLRGLVELLRRRWSKQQIVELLRGNDVDARKVAMVALSLVGCRECLCELIHHLKDPDPVVNQVAEHAIWSIWFRLGSAPANCEVHRGVQAMNAGRYDQAIRHFTRAIEMCPDFAEAWNQRAVARYLTEDYAASLSDAHQAVALNPHHFGAWSGVGHCCACLGRFDEAIEAYQRALEINPHLDCVAEAIVELRTRLN
ncbi:MAG: tetratricopeptide repeat protein [Phycisphaerae bacterium]|nr:tetratricopeptide repeat protein [Phycisphaerae bacterium]MDW8260965.1 tetratricopeptide repeat protein [Phycisphaerales bacterium]